MTKIMLVEDDNNLREIYEARLLAEGYEIVSARDGEEALALAVKEKPDLIISDVMMPKISGFDMLDILRSTPETKDTKVIMMTALSQAEDKARADKLGADRYLVKSQVTLEDVAKVAREILSGTTATPAAGSATASAPATPQPPVAVAPQPQVTTPPAPEPSAVPPAPSVPTPTPPEPAVPTDNSTPSSTPIAVNPDLSQPIKEEEAKVDNNIKKFEETNPQPNGVVSPTAAVTNQPTPAPVVSQPISTNPSPTAPTSDTSTRDDVPVAHKKIIVPINDITQKPPDLDALLAKEEAKGSSPTLNTEAVIQPTQEPAPAASTITEDSSKTPGNVIQPNGSSPDPSSLAL